MQKYTCMARIRFFNTTGPCNPEYHYMLPPEERLEQIKGYRDKIDATVQSYLVIFDRRSKSLQLPWEERIQWRTVGDFSVLGC